MSAEPAGPVAGPLERRHLGAVFSQLCALASPSGAERACAERVLHELRGLGLEVLEDQAGERLGGDCGNLLTRIEPAASAREDAPWMMLCAHLDTVPPQAPLEPLLEEGVWSNANEGILGADNKAAVAVLLTLARMLAAKPGPVGVELLFTVDEERSLAGSRQFEVGCLRSSFGYVFDHATPIGEVIVGSPTQFVIEASFHGAAAHAGIRPQDGRSAILAAARGIALLRHGLIAEEGTVNVGLIEGGSAGNVVPERCRLSAEVRGLDDVRAEKLAAEVVDRLQQAANMPDCDCDLDVTVERTFAGYRIGPSSRPLAIAEAALRSCGHEPQRIASGGGSDANTFNAAGLEVVNLANGTERAHEPGELVSELALEQMLEVALGLVEQTAQLTAAAAR